ncbi:MAG TPA: HAD family phosphatase [Saprospiraceae bacterium]
MNNKIRNLLFDLGNVIVEIDVDGAHDRLRKMYNADADESVIEKAFLDYECGRISTTIFINALLKHCERRFQAIDIIEVWNSMIIGIPAHRLEMLLQLREQHKVYLLSNTNELHLEWIHRYLRKEHKIDTFESTYFDIAYYSHLVGDRKPNASLFKFIREDSYMVPALTLFMDDVQENLDTAAKQGFQTYLVTPGEEIGDYLRKEGIYLG